MSKIMNKELKNSYRKQFPTVGPSMIETLDLLGIKSREQLKEMTAERAMQKYLNMTGWVKGKSCSCVAYGFEGIIRNCKWYDIPQHRKNELKNFVYSRREIYDKTYKNFTSK